jgi:hypothetical protein
MPLEKRDPVSKAKLFIPTSREQHLVKTQKALDQGVADVEELKKELEELIKNAKKS